MEVVGAPGGSPSSAVQPRLLATDTVPSAHSAGNGVPPGDAGGPQATGTVASPTSANRSRAMATPAAQPTTEPSATVTARIVTFGSEAR